MIEFEAELMKHIKNLIVWRRKNTMKLMTITTTISILIAFILFTSGCGEDNRQLPKDENGSEHFICSENGNGMTINISDGEASGKVTTKAIQPDDYPQHKIVVYVLSDIWYIQPKLGSFAEIKAGGSWAMSGLHIDEHSEKVGAFLVKKSYQAPDTIRRNDLQEKLINHAIADVICDLK